MMKNIFRLILFLVCILTLDSCCDAGNKHEYALLQDIEYTERNNIINKMEFREKEGYFIAGVRSEDGEENIWILLNPKFPPYYKQIPQGRYLITKNEFDAIVDKGVASETVREVLRIMIDN